MININKFLNLYSPLNLLFFMGKVTKKTYILLLLPITTIFFLCLLLLIDKKKIHKPKDIIKDTLPDTTLLDVRINKLKDLLNNVSSEVNTLPSLIIDSSEDNIDVNISQQSTFTTTDNEKVITSTFTQTGATPWNTIKIILNKNLNPNAILNSMTIDNFKHTFSNMIESLLIINIDVAKHIKLSDNLQNLFKNSSEPSSINKVKLNNDLKLLKQDIQLLLEKKKTNPDINITLTITLTTLQLLLSVLLNLPLNAQELPISSNSISFNHGINIVIYNSIPSK